MVGITLSPEQIRNAPPEVRQWLEHELTSSLGLSPSGLPAMYPTSPRLVACTADEAAQMLALIRGMLPVANVFFELGRDGARLGADGIEVFRLVDILRHTRLQTIDQVLACLDIIEEAFNHVHTDAGATFYAVDGRGHCFVAAETQRSILRVWQQIVAERELRSPAKDSGQGDAPPASELAPPMNPLTPSFHTVAPGELAS
jgi:hypothetical protein